MLLLFLQDQGFLIHSTLIVELVNLLILNLPVLEYAIVPFGAPLSLIKLVKLLVSKTSNSNYFIFFKPSI